MNPGDLNEFSSSDQALKAKTLAEVPEGKLPSKSMAVKNFKSENKMSVEIRE